MLMHRRFAVLIVISLFIFFTIHYYNQLTPSRKISKYSDKSEIVQIAQSLQSTIIFLKFIEKNLKFKVLVYGWKRRASLRRLIDSLNKVDYRGFKMNLEVHIEGDYHPLVVQYVNKLNWTHGSLEIKKRRYKAGLENVRVYHTLNIM